MNFLAHLWLTDRAGLPLAGALLGDWLRGPVPGDLPAGLAQSVRLHRRVDAVTDRHPAVRAAKAGFDPGARRYAGILLDILYDHCLARDWPEFSAEPLAGFAARAAAAIDAEQARFRAAGGPAPAPAAFSALLLSYAQDAGFEAAVARTARRLSRPQGLLQAMDGWQRRVPGLRAGLPGLLEDLRREAAPFAAPTRD